MDSQWIGCLKCGQVVRSTLLVVATGGEFRKCSACGGVAVYRSQSARGQRIKSGTVEDVIETAGEIVMDKLGVIG